MLKYCHMGIYFLLIGTIVSPNATICCKIVQMEKSPWKIGGLIRKFLAKFWGSDSDGILRIVSGLIHVCAKRESIRSPGNYYWPQAIDEYVSWIHFS